MLVMVKYCLVPIWMHHTASLPEVNGTTLPRMGLTKCRAPHKSKFPEQEWGSHHLERSLFSFGMWVGEIILTSSGSTHTHHLYGFLWRMDGLDRRVASGWRQAFKGEGGMDPLFLRWTHRPFTTSGAVMTKLWGRHQSFSSTCSMDINSIKQITGERSDKTAAQVWFDAEASDES